MTLPHTVIHTSLFFSQSCRASSAIVVFIEAFSLFPLCLVFNYDCFSGSSTAPSGRHDWHSSGTWCICKDGVSDTVLQKTLDYACGEGADCNPIHMKGPCFNPDTVRAHCNYSVNSFFQRKGQAQGTCDFASTATLTTSDPSYAGCPFAATASAASTTTTPKTTPSTTTPNVNPINNNPTPYGSTTPTGMLGGVGNGLSPSGSGINPDYSTDDGGFRLQYCFSSNGTLLLSGFMLLWA